MLMANYTFKFNQQSTCGEVTGWFVVESMP